MNPSPTSKSVQSEAKCVVKSITDDAISDSLTNSKAEHYILDAVIDCVSLKAIKEDL